MPESRTNNDPLKETLINVHLLQQGSKQLAESIAQLHKANVEIKKSRRAALNMLEDSVLSKAALVKSEERLQLVLKSAKIGTFIYYPQEDRGDPDAQMLALYGLSPNDTLNLNKALAEIIHPDDRKRYADDVAKAVNPAGKGRLDSDIRIIHPDGSLHWMNVTAQVIFEDGKPVRMSGVSIDITERKQAEEALRTSEAQLRALVENLPGGAVFVVDKNLRYLLAAGEALMNAGAAPDDFLGKAVDEVLYDEILDVHKQNYLRALDGESFIDEHQVNNRTYISRGTPLTDSAGEVYAVLVISYDITDRKDAEEALRVSEERYRIALESANMGAWDWNIKDDKVIWNDQHYHILGIKPHNEKKNADYFLQFIHTEDRERVTGSLMKAVEAGGTYQADFRIVRADNNEVHWMVGYGSTINKEDGRATRMVGVMFDITDRKKLEQQKEDFIGIASHELKTPVTSIKAYTEVLHEIFEESEDATSAGLLGKLDTQIDRLIDLIRTLLDTSKLSEGELSLHFEKFEICKLIEERIADLQQLSSSHHIELKTTKEVFVTADRERVGQVLNNFISNAIKYSPNGGDIIIRCEQTGNKLQVSVKDSGIGISEEMQQKIFDRFFRVKTEQAKNIAGLGLGLFITAYLIQKHGGEIWVKSKPGKGSTFYFSLPADNT